MLVWEDNRNHRWIPPICERRAAFSSHPPTPISIDIFPLFSHFGIVIFKGAVKQGEKELQSRLENLKMCVHTPSNDNLGDRHVNLVYERDSGRADTRTLDEVEGQIHVSFVPCPYYATRCGHLPCSPSLALLDLISLGWKVSSKWPSTAPFKAFVASHPIPPPLTRLHFPDDASPGTSEAAQVSLSSISNPLARVKVTSDGE